MNGHQYLAYYYGLLSTVEMRDPFVHGHLYSPEYCGILSTLQITDPFMNGIHIRQNTVGYSLSTLYYGLICDWASNLPKFRVHFG